MHSVERSSASADQRPSPNPLPEGERSKVEVLKPLGWILRSYLTRPLVLGIGAFGMLTFALSTLGAYMPSHPQPNYPRPPRGRLIVDSPAALEAIRAAGRQNDVDMLDLVTLWRKQGVRTRWDEQQQTVIRELPPPDDDFFRVIDEFPNVRRVTFDWWDNGARLERLTALKQLEAIEIQNWMARPRAEELAGLARVKSLRRIEWAVYDPLEGLDQLAALPHLETMVFTSRFSLNDGVLAQIAALPQLETLVLDLWSSSPAREPITVDGLAALAGAPRLKTVYVGDPRPGESGRLMWMARRALPPRIAVEAARGARAPFGAMFFSLMPSVTLALGIGFHLSSQMRSPLVRLAPRYGSMHGGVAVALAAALVVTVSFWLVRSGAALVPAVGVSLLAVSAIVSGSAMSSLQGQVPFSRATRGGLATWANVVPTATIFGLLALMFIPGLLDRLLSGYYGAAVAACYAVAAGCIAAGIWLYGQLPAIAAGATGVSNDRQAAIRFAGANLHRSWWTNLARREWQIEVLRAEGPARGWWARVRRWQLGTQPYPVLAMPLLLAIFMVVFQLPIYWGMGLEIELVDWLRSQAWIALAAMMMYALQVGGLWRMRRGVFPLELLRPGEDRVLRTELASAFVFDLVPGVAVCAALGAVLVAFGDVAGWAWWTVPQSFAGLVVCGLPLALVLAAIVAIVERLWLALLLGVLYVWAIIGLFTSVWIYMQSHESPAPRILSAPADQASPATLMLLLGATLVSLLVVARLLRYWKRLEVGRF